MLILPKNGVLEMEDSLFHGRDDDKHKNDGLLQISKIFEMQDKLILEMMLFECRIVTHQ